MSFAVSTLHVAVSDGAPAFVAQAASDPGSSRLVYAMVIGLALVGVASVVLAVWLIRQTRVDPDVLAPLERMGDGDWRRKDPATQRRLLDDVRPDGAEPLHTEPAPPSVDDEFENADRSMRSLDDLEPLSPEGAHTTPAGGAPLPDIIEDADSADPLEDAAGREVDRSDVAGSDAVIDGSDAVVAGDEDDGEDDGEVDGGIVDAQVDQAGETRTTDAERR